MFHAQDVKRDAEAGLRDKEEKARDFAIRSEADRMNRTKMQKSKDLLTTLLSTNKQDVFITGTEPCTDPFDGRPDEEKISLERKRLYGTKLRKQMAERREKAAKDTEEEKRYADLSRERELAVRKAIEERDAKKKRDSQAEQRDWLRTQMEEPKFEMLRIAGYSDEGDPFTLGVDPTPEEIAQRKRETHHILRTQMAHNAIDKEKEEAAFKAWGREAAEMEMKVRKEEVEAELERREILRVKVDQALRKQMEERKPLEGVVGYDSDGDRFTRGESVEEVFQKKMDDRAKLVEGYDKQMAKNAALKEEEEAEAKRIQAETKKNDAEDVAFEKAKEEERAKYSQTYGQLQADQIREQREAKTREFQESRKPGHMYTSPDIGEAPDLVDCERPYYRSRQITKKERLLYGF
jgi:hypothetical protein